MAGEIPIDSASIFPFAASVLVYGREQLLAMLPATEEL
jgi:hypothetical protein